MIDPLLEHLPQPWDAPRVKEETPRVLFWNRIAKCILMPAFFCGWAWVGFQGAAQEPAAANGVGDVAAVGICVAAVGLLVLVVGLLFVFAVRRVGSRLP